MQADNATAAQRSECSWRFRGSRGSERCQRTKWRSRECTDTVVARAHKPNSFAELLAAPNGG